MIAPASPADAWDRIRKEAEDLKHCPIGVSLKVGMMANELAGLFEVGKPLMESALADATLRTRRKIVLECIEDYLRLVRATTAATAEPAASDGPAPAGDAPEPDAIRRARRRA